MKCETLVVRPFKPDARTSVTLPSGQVAEIGVEIEAPVGSIIEGPHAFWLCHQFQDFLRPLSGGRVEHVLMDGMGGQKLQYVAKPADQQCVDQMIAEGWSKPGTTFTPKTAPVSAPDVTDNDGENT